MVPSRLRWASRMVRKQDIRTNMHGSGIRAPVKSEPETENTHKGPLGYARQGANPK